MTDTLQYFFNPAQLFGYAAFVLGVLSFLQKDDQEVSRLENLYKSMT